MDKDIVVIGGGGHAKVVVSTLIDLGLRMENIYDDDQAKRGATVCGVKIIGPLSGLDSSADHRALVGIGDNRTRFEISKRFEKYNWVTAVHSRALVHRSVSVGEGSVIFAGAIVQPDTIIGKHCIINTNAIIDHDCIIEDYSHIGPGVALAGNVTVGEGAFLGIGSAVIMGKTIGKWTIIGAGGAVINNIPDNAVAVGVPAKIIKRM